jgi:hypothetical protein
MSFFKTLLGFFATTLLIIACKKELSNEEGNLNTEVESKWEFKEGGQQFDGTTDTAFIQSIGTIQTLTITGAQAEGLTGEIMIQIAGEQINTGLYGTQFVLFQFLQDGAVSYTSLPVEGSDFVVNITAIDSSSVTGTFSGTVEDALGNTYSISEGKFTAKLGAGQVQNPPIESGQLTVWTKQICSDASAVEVTVMDQTGQITDAFTAQPDCGAPGTAVFTLPAGIYTVTATCSGTSVDYEVTIDRECVFLEADLQNPDLSGDYLPLTLGASWSYNDLLGTAAEQTITSEEEGIVIDERGPYSKLTSDNGAEYLYRKDGHKYYQYLTMGFQGAVTNPPSIEVLILQDDLAEGSHWETPFEDLNWSGIDLKGKLVFTISKKDFSSNINGVDYSDLIEVTAELFLSPDGVSNVTSVGAFKRVFAKGIGIIQYDDLNQATTWGITNVVLNP